MFGGVLRVAAIRFGAHPRLAIRYIWPDTEYLRGTRQPLTSLSR